MWGGKLTARRRHRGHHLNPAGNLSLDLVAADVKVVLRHIAGANVGAGDLGDQVALVDAARPGMIAAVSRDGSREGGAEDEDFKDVGNGKDGHFGGRVGVSCWMNKRKGGES